MTGIGEKRRNATTFSGIGLLNLNNLTVEKKSSSFFETVANFKKDSVKVLLVDEYEYWDWGTRDLFFNNYWDVLEKESAMRTFLLKEKIMIEEKINLEKRAYGAEKENIINLGSMERKKEIGNSVIYFEDSIVSSATKVSFFVFSGLRG